MRKRKGNRRERNGVEIKRERKTHNTKVEKEKRER